MANPVKIGDKKSYQFKVSAKDVAAFNNEVVHQVCSTFVLAREIEWATRQYVLEMKQEDEEGVGTRLEIEHKAPAFVGDQVTINSEVISFEKNELICNYVALVGDRVIAKGVTGQKLLKKAKLKEIFSTFN